MGTKCVFLTTTWDCENWVLTWIWAKERQLSNLQALYFYLFLLSKIRHFTATVIQFSQNETFSRVFIHCVQQRPSIDSSFWPPKMRLLEGFSSTVHTWNENETILDNFQLLWTWNETILEDFHPQWSLNNPKKLCRMARGLLLSDNYSQKMRLWTCEFCEN